MKTPAISYVVNNPDGDSYKKNEILYEYKSDDGSISKIYESRTLFPYAKLDDGTFKSAFISVEDVNQSGKDAGYNYVIYFHINYYDKSGEWVSYVQREVLCEKKSETKKVLKDMLAYHKEDPDRMVSLAPGEWMYQVYEKYNLTALLSDKDKK